MRYMIHCLLKGPVEKYQKDLVEEIANKFGLTLTKEENLATHFTIKYSFETNQIQEIEKILEDFCKNHKRSKIKVEGFNNFHPNTIFIDIKLSDEAKELVSDFNKELKKINWMSWEPYDAENLHPHSTIAERCGKKHEEVWQFLKDKENSFDCWLDNITILKKIGTVNEVEKWEIHKSFVLN
jgi:2'-5' RNA ligase